MLMLDRRMLLRAGSAAVGAAALTPTAPALARAPRAGERAQPSFYRFKLGTIEITVVSDGTLAFPAETLWGDRAEDARGLLTSTFQHTDEQEPDCKHAAITCSDSPTPSQLDRVFGSDS